MYSMVSIISSSSRREMLRNDISTTAYEGYLTTMSAGTCEYLTHYTPPWSLTYLWQDHLKNIKIEEMRKSVKSFWTQEESFVVMHKSVRHIGIRYLVFITHFAMKPKEPCCFFGICVSSQCVTRVAQAVGLLRRA